MSSDLDPPVRQPTRETALDRARRAGIFSALDVHFARRLAALYEEERPEIVWALAIACRQEAAGHVCADLPWLAEEGFPAPLGMDGDRFEPIPESLDLSTWLDRLATSPVIERVGASARRADPPAGVLLDALGRLYLSRSFESQASLAEALRARAVRPDLDFDPETAEARITRLVAGDPADAKADAPDEIDWSAVALRMALARPLSVITGGPGTGKTTLVFRLVVLLIESALMSGQAPPRVRLVAPTGRAAAALSGSFAFQRDAIDLDPEVRAALPTAAETIHRALRIQTRRDALGRAEDFALEADLVIVDEASMIDLAMMARLFDASREVERIVLLGDPDQLASVEAGAVLAEICSGASENASEAAAEADGKSGKRPEPSLARSIVTLRKSHRFAAGGGIGRLASAIRAGDADETIALLADPELPEIELIESDGPRMTGARLSASVAEIQRALQAESRPEAKLEILGRYRVLCALRRGPFGVEALCPLLDEAAALERGTHTGNGWWLGRMLLITRNAPDLDLWNGDVGVIEQWEGELRAIFADGRGGCRAFASGRLPEHEGALAMSVHKSQGSEFDDVDLVLGDTLSRLSTRELLYTGVTRARERLRIHASAEMVRASVECRVHRASGLRELLWSDSEVER